MTLRQFQNVGFCQSFCIFQRQIWPALMAIISRTLSYTTKVCRLLLLIWNLFVPIEDETWIWLRVTLNRDAGGGGLFRNSEKMSFQNSERNLKIEYVWCWLECSSKQLEAWSRKRSRANCSGSWMQMVVLVSWVHSSCGDAIMNNLSRLPIDIHKMCPGRFWSSFYSS